MNRNRWIVIIVCTVLALIAITLSVFIGGGCALIPVEPVAVGVIVVLFLRGQRGDGDPEPGDK
jgi:uncharacterized membrane protein